MKKNCLMVAAVFLFQVVLGSFLTVTAQAQSYSPPHEVSAQYVYLYNLDTETLIYEKNSNEAAYPASLTKIMTCLLALEMTEDLDSTLLTYPLYIQDFLYDYQYVKKNGAVSLAGLSMGETLSMRQMLYALMLPSGNEAALIIADYLGGGSQQTFIEMMNKRAKELGANNTNFVNPNGLFDESHTTTAKDMFLIARHAMSVPGFMDIVSTTSYETGPTNKHDNLTWRTTNQMMVPASSYYYPALQGIKTGTLPQAGKCLVSTASKDGFTYLMVVMGAPMADSGGNAYAQDMNFSETKRLYDWVFDTFKVKALVEKGKYVSEVELKLSMDKDFVQVMTAERFTALLPDDIEASSVTLVPVVPESLNAPIQKGDEVGYLRLLLSGDEVGQVKLVAAESVAETPVLVFLEKFKSILGSFWFKFAVVLVVLLIILYSFWMIMRNKRRRTSSYRPRRRL
ncbi:D-alanyl-D-alanine carboxypeptidase family protein [Oscillospiraceae bacterium MB08-C2-2]|nr:D-alanyl-D-alanine carboxypeptidase family protein [Oscillospiraceae bacterium MB08-C2-2]